MTIEKFIGRFDRGRCSLRWDIFRQFDNIADKNLNMSDQCMDDT